MMSFVRSVSRTTSSAGLGGRSKFRLTEQGELAPMDGSFVGIDGADDDTPMRVSDADMKRHQQLLRRQHFMK